MKIFLMWFFGVVLGLGLGILITVNLVSKDETAKYNNRCMKYFGSKGYPNNYYCKLFIGEIKARDE